MIDWITDNVLVFSVIKIVAIIVPLMLGVAYLTYAERKVIGYIQLARIALAHGDYYNL